MTDDHDRAAVVLVEGVRKRRGDTTALDGVSFAIPPGSIFGLIGPNGAGKTTTIKLLLGLLRPDAGRVEVFGREPMLLPAADRRRIGYLGERTDHLPDLSVRELLEYHSCFFDAWDWAFCRELIDRMRLREGQDVHAMSEGERRKTELLLALAHRPELLILDDPALGLDARARREILWATLAAARDEGTAILFTSHVLQDVQRIVDDVLVLDRGRVRAAGALDEVLAATKRIVVCDVGDADGAEVPTLPGEVQRTWHGRDLALVTTAFSSALVEQLRLQHDQVEVVDLNLEEIFCTIVGANEPAAPATHEVVR